MPTRNDIYDQISKTQAEAPDRIRREYLKELAVFTGNDTIIYSTSFTSGKPAPPNSVSINIQDIQGFMGAMHSLKSANLDLILHSPGGSLEATEQIVKYLRSKYHYIRAIIPQNAMSAATMLACACDEIVMGKHSAIGPIDPQITVNTGGGAFTAPAQSILDEFEKAKEEIINNPKSAAIWIKRIDKYPVGFIQICQNTIALSQERVSEWLATWMLAKDPDRDSKSKRIAEWLSAANIHLSHGRPFNYDEAEKKGLRITLLENDQDFQEHVLSVFHATMATHDFTNCVKLIENQEGKGSFYSIKPPQ